MSFSVLVVGGAGYIGSHTVNLLVKNGHSVTVFDNLSRGHRDAALSVDFVEGDLLRADHVRDVFRSRRFDVVMHFAAFCYVGESVLEPRAYYRNNLVGTLNLLDGMLDASIGSLVFSSTCSTYGSPVELPMSESHPQHPINPYGASKLMVETVLRDYERAYGLKSVALRYFNAAGTDPGGVLGERHDPETHLIPLVLLEALRIREGGDPSRTSLVVHGGDYETPDGTCVRDYVHVNDIASAHVRAALSLLAGTLSGAKAFNLGIDRGFSVLQVIDACRAVTKVPIQFKMGPRRLGDPPCLIANSAAARAELGWRPEYLELDQIIETAWNWFAKSHCRSHPDQAMRQA